MPKNKKSTIDKIKKKHLTLTICLNVNARGGSNIPTSFCVVRERMGELTNVFVVDSPV